MSAPASTSPGFATTSPRFMAYIPGGGLFHSALGDLLAAASNKYSGFASASPGAVRIENACAAWLASVIGYPADAAGTLTSGGSIANLTAIVAAREARDPDGGGAVYVTRFAHHCVDKALHIAGRGRSPRAHDRDRRRTTACRSRRSSRRWRRTARNGIRPWLVVASAGTVDTGAIDPLPEIAELCRRYGAWLHVDGAYGGPVRAVRRGRERCCAASSRPTASRSTRTRPCSCPTAPARRWSATASICTTRSARAREYIRPLGESEVGPSPADLSPELTRHFRALRLWLPLQIAGVAAFRAAQSEKLALARYFHARLSEIDGFDPGPAARPLGRRLPLSAQERRRRRIQRAADHAPPAGRPRDDERHADRRQLSTSAARSSASAPISSMSTKRVDAIVRGVAALDG